MEEIITTFSRKLLTLTMSSYYSYEDDLFGRILTVSFQFVFEPTYKESTLTIAQGLKNNNYEIV